MAGEVAVELLRVGLVGCGKDKHPGIHPAGRLYRGALTRGGLAEAEAACDEVFILSAKHHLLALDQPTEEYQEELPEPTSAEKRARLDAWSKVVAASLIARYGDRPVHVVIYAGAKYAWLTRFLPAGWTVEEPMKGLQQGERLGWLKRQRMARSGPGLGL